MTLTADQEAVALVMTDRDEWDALRRLVSDAQSVTLNYAPEPGIPFCTVGIPAGIIAALMDALDVAVEVERKRITLELSTHISRSAHPVFAHFDSYGVGQIVQGKPWPEGRR